MPERKSICITISIELTCLRDATDCIDPKQLDSFLHQVYGKRVNKYRQGLLSKLPYNRLTEQEMNQMGAAIHCGYIADFATAHSLDVIK